MLMIYLHESQEELLPDLKRVYPDLTPTRRVIYPNHRGFRACERDAEEGWKQRCWLLAHHILHCDSELLYEERVRAFVRHATLDPQVQRTLSLSFAHSSEQPGMCRVRMRSRDQQATLYLLPGWTGRPQAPYKPVVSALLVSREGGRWTACELNDRGCLGKLLACKTCAQEMTSWLLEHAYIQLYSFAQRPDLCGLYTRLFRSGVGELARTDG